MLWRASAIQDKKTQKIIEEIPAPLIKYLVFEGGGIRGIAYAGVIEELEKAHFIATVEHVAGSSIGAVAALLIAIGCTSLEINELLGELSFDEFLEGEKPWPITPELITKGKQCLSILATDNYSISTGKLFLEWIEKIIAKKLGNKHATFADLEKLVKQNGKLYKYLSVTGSNLSKNRLEIFNHETTPDMPIASAIRISASFPGVFKPVELKRLEEVVTLKQTKDGVVEETKMQEVTNVMVDGGLMNNLPSFIFVDEDKLPEGLGFNRKGINASILNIKVDTEDEIRQVLWNSAQPKPITGIKNFSRLIFDGTQSRDTEIYEQYSTNTFQVDDAGIDTLKFNITQLEKMKLIESGREAARQWLETHVSEAYKINVYNSEAAWLASKKIEELVFISNAYEEKLQAELSGLSEHKNESNMASQTTIIEIKEKIAWLREYLRYRFEILSTPLKNQFPMTPHIDLDPIKPRQVADEIIKENMQAKLIAIENEITILEPKIKDISFKIELNKCNDHLHNLMVFDFIIYLSKLKERLKVLHELRKDLLHKTRTKDMSADIQWSTKERLLFHFQIKARLSEKQTAFSPHVKLMSILDRHLYRGFASYQTDEGVKGSLDLKNIKDLKLYVMACFLYLKYINSKDILMKDISIMYQRLFGCQQVPTSLQELGVQLKEENVELLLSAYRIEGIIKNFMRVDKPKQKSSLVDLDIIFKSLAPSMDTGKKIFTRNRKTVLKEDVNDFEMDLVYQPFSHESSDKFSLFCKQTEQADLYHQSPKINLHAEENAKKVPKCLKRLPSV